MWILILTNIKSPFDNVISKKALLFVALINIISSILEFQFKPQYGKPYFAAVGSGPYDAVNRWGKSKKIKVKAKMKKIMAKELNDAINSKYNGSEETDVLLRNRSLVGSLYSVLSWVKKL